jgi:hypothetical protein
METVGIDIAAFHEAGHAVVHYRLGLPITELGCEIDEDGTPAFYILPHADSGAHGDLRLSRPAIVAFFAGGEAARRYCLDCEKRATNVGNVVDLNAIRGLLCELPELSRAERSTLCKELRAEAQEMLVDPATWRAVQSVASLLLRHARKPSTSEWTPARPSVPRCEIIATISGVLGGSEASRARGAREHNR